MPRVYRPSDQLLSLVRRQDGVVLAAQLCGDGFSRRAADNRVERGRWRRLLPGVLLTSSGQPTRRQLLVAASLWAGPAGAIDAGDACVWYGLQPSQHRPDRVHVVVPARSPQRSRGFVAVREASAEIRIGARGFVPYVDAATAVIVAARNFRTEAGANALLSRALQTGLVSESALAEARSAIGSKGCRGVDADLIAVGVGLRSPAEKDNRDLILTSRVLPEPLWNQWLDLGDGEGLVCADALWDGAGMVDEVNGRRYHAWGERFENTEERRARMEAAGLAVSGCTPSQLRRQPQRVLDRKERTYLQHAGRGMPPGVRLVDPPIPQ